MIISWLTNDQKKTDVIHFINPFAICFTSSLNSFEVLKLKLINGMAFIIIHYVILPQFSKIFKRINKNPTVYAGRLTFTYAELNKVDSLI